jgi:hypothetical protein
MVTLSGADCGGGAQVVSGLPASGGPAAPGQRSAGSARGNLLAGGRYGAIADTAINPSAGELISDAAAPAASALGSSAGPLAVGALLAGASAVKIAARRGRERRAGIGAWQYGRQKVRAVWLRRQVLCAAGGLGAGPGYGGSAWVAR